MKNYLDFINEDTNFQSEFEIGSPVQILIQNCVIEGHIRHIGFTNGKVRYAVSILTDIGEGKEGRTTFHNIDSIFVKDREGEKLEFEFDNYS